MADYLFPQNAIKAEKLFYYKKKIKIKLTGSNIHVQAYSSTPTELLDAICERVKSGDITNLRLNHSYLNGPVSWDHPKCHGMFILISVSPFVCYMKNL